MSLLLDALKRAEQEKQARATDPPAARTPARASLELAPVVPAEPPGGSARASVNPGAAAAAPRLAPAARRRTGLWIAGGVVTLAIAGVVGYVWYSVSALAPRSAPLAAAPLRPIVPAPAPEPPKTQAPTDLAPRPAADERAAPAPAPSRQAAVAPRAPRAAAETAAEETLLKPARAQAARIPAEVSGGYEALRRGNLADAKRLYSAALAADPANLDALLGLATSEARGGQRDAAAAWYRRALAIDPRNATALAGLAALAESSRPDALEAELARDLALNPASAALHFQAGNLHASQSRWSQAQAAYFEAHRLDPGNADILHNLAVSLDRLGQSRLAAGFYRRALEAARAEPSQVDAQAVQRRLAEIESGR